MLTSLKVATEVILGLIIIPEISPMRRRAFDSAEGRFDERIVIRGAGAPLRPGSTSGDSLLVWIASVLARCLAGLPAFNF